MAFEPGPVVVEVSADGPDEHRPQPESRHTEGDVRCDAAASDVEVFHEEGQGHLVQLIRDQLIGEPSREAHEVIRRDRAGHDDAHWSVSSAWSACAFASKPATYPSVPLSGLRTVALPWISTVRPIPRREL